MQMYYVAETSINRIIYTLSEAYTRSKFDPDVYRITIYYITILYSIYYIVSKSIVIIILLWTYLSHYVLFKISIMFYNNSIVSLIVCRI